MRTLDFSGSYYTARASTVADTVLTSELTGSDLLAVVSVLSVPVHFLIALAMSTTTSLSIEGSSG